jgi:hypothetical protein
MGGTYPPHRLLAPYPLNPYDAAARSRNFFLE